MAWSIYDDRMQEFCHNYTGGGLMIKNICEYIGRKQESYLFIGRCKLAGFKLGNIYIVDTKSYAVEDVKDEGFDNNETYLRQMTRAFEASIEHIEPDIVNFHGIGVLMQRCIEVCHKKKIPYVYTDHLFIDSKTDIQGYRINIEYQKKVYQIPDIKVIAVSTGMKRKILEDFPNILPEDVHVIRNGTNFSAIKENGDLQQKYDLAHKKVLLCVGTLNYRKNQCQVVKAFQLLSRDIQENLKIIFCGKDNMNGKLQADIIEARLQNRLIYVGTVSSEEMKKYYSLADGLIMSSYAEGLSIAALEAIAYGLPVIMFADSECAEDLDDEKVTCFAKRRTDESLASAIQNWYHVVWDEKYIIEYSKGFTMERVADEYIEYYKSRLNQKVRSRLEKL